MVAGKNDKVALKVVLLKLPSTNRLVLVLRSYTPSRFSSKHSLRLQGAAVKQVQG